MLMFPLIPELGFTAPVVRFPAWLRRFYCGEEEYEPTYERLKARLGHGVGLELLRPLDGLPIIPGAVDPVWKLVRVCTRWGQEDAPLSFSGKLPIEWFLPCPVCRARPGEDCREVPEPDVSALLRMPHDARMLPFQPGPRRS